MLIKELRAMGLGAYVAGVFIGVAAYADDLVLITPTRHAMQLMLNVCEDIESRYNIFMMGRVTNLAKPVPLTLCGQDLPVSNPPGP
jgi:hypothetical protein